MAGSTVLKFDPPLDSGDPSDDAFPCVWIGDTAPEQVQLWLLNLRNVWTNRAQIWHATEDQSEWLPKVHEA